MKKYNKVFLLVVFALACISSIVAQIEGDYGVQMTAEQLREEIRIQKQQLKVAAKEFLVDELPAIIEMDPNRAEIELQKFSSVLRYLGDNDVLYLLGHMYARVGENDKAITIFDTLLRTDLNQGARRMLNLVLYRKLIELLQAGDRQAAKDYLRVIVFENYNTEQYFPAYLYLYADLSAESRNYTEVRTLIDSYNSNRNVVLNSLLPMKQQVLGRINNLNFASYYDNPSQTLYNQLSSQIDQVKVDLTAIYNMMIGLEGMIFVDAIVEAHKTEMAQMDDLKKLLADYANTTITTEEQLKPALRMIDSVKQNLAFYNRLLKSFDNLLQQNFLRLTSADPQGAQVYAGDLYLDRIIQTRKTIASYDEMILDIDELLTSGSYPEHTERLVRERQWAVTKKAEAEVLHQKYLADLQSVDASEKVYMVEILAEYDALVQDNRMLAETARDMESYVVTEARTIINQDLRSQIRPRIASQANSIAYSGDRDRIFTSGFGQALTGIDFITLQMAYRLTMAEFNDFLNTQSALSSQELDVQREYWRQEQLNLIAEFNAFLAANPGFSAIDQPGGGSLASAADLYYNLAELQYYAVSEDLNVALASYQRALALDPNLPDRDLALYNVAFITSEIKRTEVSNNKIAYRQNARINQAAPANALYSEANFRESQNALLDIVNNHKDSRVYEESIYRLGLLNFSYSTDSENPVPYREKAIEYFDAIVANRQSRLYYDALYQRGWVRLNSFDEQDLRLAMTDFMEILIATDAGLIADAQVAQDYRKDAVDNIAYCLIALDGTDFTTRSRGVAELQRVFEGYNDQQILQQVINQSAKLKRDMGASLQTVDFLEFKISTVPLALENPVLLDSILVLYHNSSQQLREGENLAEITQSIYQRQIDNYNHDSQWYNVNKDRDISRQMQIVENAYTERGFRLYNIFASSYSRENLVNYENHMSRFDAFARLHKENYPQFRMETDSLLVYSYSVLAERTRNIPDLIEAIQRIYTYNDTYPANSMFFANEELAMSYARFIYAAVVAPGYAPESGAPADENQGFALLKRSADRFVDVSNQERFRNPTRIANALNVILLLGQIQTGKELYPEAIAYYNRALEQADMMSNSDKRETYLTLADISIRQQRFTDAEEWFKQALPFAVNAEDRANINQDILVQIQSNFEKAADSGDYILEATERLRLASQLSPSLSSDILGHKNQAVEAFKKAGAYQRAIDLLMELAATDNNLEAVYARYSQAFEIAEADSMMNNPALAKQLEQDFIDKYPSSNYSFGLRMAAIAPLADSPTTRATAAEKYLQLYEEVVARRIDSGSVPESTILAFAVAMYNQDGNVPQGYALMNRFIAAYPNHTDVVPYMEYMAKGYYDRKETAEYNRLAREIFRKDPSKSSYYQGVAESELFLIAQEFDVAVSNVDFDAAFAARDRYRSVEAAYKREGLRFNENIYQEFTALQTRYDEIKKREAFLANYDSRLNALERSTVFTQTPAQQIRVVAATRWDTNMVGGDRRISKYMDTINAEANKIQAVIRSGFESGYDIDNNRQIRALALISRLYTRGEEVVDAQIRAYFRTSSEGRDTRNYYGASFDEMERAFIWNITKDYVSQSLSWDNQIYTRFHLAGYQNTATEAAKARLAKYEQELEYRGTEFVLNNQWERALEPSGSNLSFAQIRSPKGQNLGSTQVPANNTLRVSRQFNIDLEPDFAYLHVVFPMDIEVKLNGSLVNSIWVAVDTLDTAKPATTRYTFQIAGSLFTKGANLIEIELNNSSAISLQGALALQTMTSLSRLRQNIPPVVRTIFTNQGWRMISTNPDTGEEVSRFASDATEWNISQANLADLEQNAARPIWVSEINGPVENLVFETDFIVDSEFKEGMIELIAPESAKVYLNGSEIGNTMFDYDPDPLLVYKGEVIIPAANVVTGRNVLRFEVSNSSVYRGFLAKITYSQAGKEEIR